MRKLLLSFLILLCATLSASAQVTLSSDSTHLTVHLTQAGTLSNYVDSALNKKVSFLTISGQVNSDDILTIRRMLGVDTNGYKFWDDEGGVLTRIDMKDARIVAGGQPYYNYYDFETHTTANDTIGTYMFARTNLDSIVLPSSVKYISDEAFYSCSHLKQVTLPEELRGIGSSAFAYCRELNQIDLPDKLQSIGDAAFLSCNSLESVYLPAALKSFDAYGFAGLPSLKTFKVDPDNKVYTSIDGVVYTKGLDTLVAYPYGKEDTTYTVNPATHIIGHHAFWGNSTLQSVSLPEGLKGIDEGAFNTNKFSNLVLPKGLKYIGRCAFLSSDNLKSLTLPETVDSVGEMAFFASHGITEVNFGKSLRYVGKEAFKGISASELDLPATLEYVGASGLASSNLTKCTARGTVPAKCEGDVFGLNDRKQIYNDYTEAYLYVPAGTKADYEQADGWNTFDGIEEMSVDAITSLPTARNASQHATYNLAGERVSASTRGIVIMRVNGKARKVYNK